MDDNVLRVFSKLLRIHVKLHVVKRKFFLLYSNNSK